jgi:hypothetical protein
MPQGFWDQFSRAAPQAYNQSAAIAARNKQEEEQRKYYADKEKARKAEEREYRVGLNKQIADAKEQNRVKAVTPVAEGATQHFSSLVQQGLMTPQDVQTATQHIMAQSGGDAAYDTMLDWEKRFTPPKPTKPKAPSADEKFNYVMKAYFAGQGEQLSPSQWNILRKAMPSGMKDVPLTPPEGVTSISTLRKYQQQQKKQTDMTVKIDQAKREWRSAREEEEKKRAEAKEPDKYKMHVPDFDQWMRQSGQIKSYGKAYALWRKQQLQGQIDRAASGARTPAQESPQFQHSPFEGLPANVQAAIPPATGMPQGTPQVTPAGQQERQATQAQINAIQQLEEQMRALEASLR